MNDEQAVLTYIVRVSAYGDPDKIARDVGKRLAKVCNLNFSDVRIFGHGNEFRWSTNDHGGGLGPVDAENDNGVSSSQ